MPDGDDETERIDPEFARRFFEHWDVAVRVAERILDDRGHAEEAASEALIKVSRWATRRGEPRSYLGLYVHVTMQKAAAIGKREGRTLVLGDQALEAKRSRRARTPGEEPGLRALLAAAELAPCIELLNAVGATALFLFHYFDMTWERVGEELGETANYSRGIAFVAKGDLRECIEANRVKDGLG